MSNKVNAILKELESIPVIYEDLTKYKFKHSDVSRIEPLMSREDYAGLVNDIKLVGNIHTPAVIYRNEIIDGRHRQKAGIELGMELPVKVLQGNYSKEQLSEYVRSIHMNRNKTKTQKEIQAFRYKQTVANVTWEEASVRHAVSARSVQRINSFYNLLRDSNMSTEFDKVMAKFELGLSLIPTNFVWISSSTSTFSGALKQLKAYLELCKDDSIESDIDITEVNKDTGEYLVKQENIFINKNEDTATVAELMEIIKELREEIVRLKQGSSS